MLLRCVLLLFSVSVFAAEVQKNSLLFHSWSRYSQFGEEGILEEILRRLQIDDGFFVEFGAANGLYLSNTRFLAERGWKGAFIEASPELIEEAMENCKDLPHVQLINEFVAPNKASKRGMTLDTIAEIYFPEEEIDVLSIDIDGSDYLILENLRCKPKIILIEGGIYWSPTLRKRIPDAIAAYDLNQPLPEMFSIAAKKGYTPVCFTINTFFIRNDLASCFQEIENDPESLYWDSWYYYSEKYPHHIEYVRRARDSNSLIRKYDPK